MKHPKAKGSRLERKVARMIREKGLDKKASRMPLSGSFWQLKSDIFTTLPYAIEVKNQETIHFWTWWNKIRDQAGYKTPMLVISGNNRPIISCIELDKLLDLMKNENNN